MLKLLAKSPTQSKDVHTLLTWLDKVRVGLWLASYVIQKNVSAIIPHYYINSRIDLFDRMVLLYKSDGKDLGSGSKELLPPLSNTVQLASQS